MVTRVYGVANGSKVIFIKAEGDRWETTVPFSEDGEYIVEIYAEDNAGNSAYLCSMLWVVFGHQMVSYIVPRGFDGTAAELEMKTEVDFQEYLGTVLETGLYVNSEEVIYQTKIEERGYTIECKLCR